MFATLPRTLALALLLCAAIPSIARAQAVTPPTAAPGLAAQVSSGQVVLTWTPVSGVSWYRVFGAANGVWSGTPLATVREPGFVASGLANGTFYTFKVAALNEAGLGPFSNEVRGTPLARPTILSASPGEHQVTLTWTAVAGAASYEVYRRASGSGFALLAPAVSGVTFVDIGLTVGSQYSYAVRATSATGASAFSDAATATPLAAPTHAPPAAPANLVATGGTRQITLSWTPVAGASSYRVYRGTASNALGPTPLASALTTSAFVDSSVAGAIYYYYRVTAVAGAVEGEGSREAAASTAGIAPAADPATVAAYRLVRHATWGARPGDVDRVKLAGADAFLAEQFAAPPSVYPSTLFDQPLGMAQQQFLGFALTGKDQLRQRVTWALHKIWIVSGMEVNNSGAVLAYYATVQNGAFGNYRDLMRAITLSPAMGRYLNMINGRSQAVSGSPANENYARELMQLFTIGTSSYTEADVKALARILTGWTFGDGVPSTLPTKAAAENWRVPMEPVERFHDVTAKTFLGETFPAGQSATQDLEQALDLLFEHPNTAPFISRQLIQQLVTSNPSAKYVADVAAVFNGATGAPRGDIPAVVRAILLHPEANALTPQSGKLSEPLLFVTSVLRGLNAKVTDFPALSERLTRMGQIPFYPASVFGYFSPDYTVRGTGTPPLRGPEFQILTTATAFERANFVASLLGDVFGAGITVDYAPFVPLAGDAAALVDACNAHFLGGALPASARTELINAVNVTPPGNPGERVRTALYLTLVAGHGQVDR